MSHFRGKCRNAGDLSGERPVCPECPPPTHHPPDPARPGLPCRGAVLLFTSRPSSVPSHPSGRRFSSRPSHYSGSEVTCALHCNRRRRGEAPTTGPLSIQGAVPGVAWPGVVYARAPMVRRSAERGKIPQRQSWAGSGAGPPINTHSPVVRAGRAAGPGRLEVSGLEDSTCLSLQPPRSGGGSGPSPPG